jgi:hypothetical protein
MISKRALINIAFFLCFFPSLFYFLVKTQTQPVGGLIACVILLKWGIKRNAFSLLLLVFITVVFMYALIGLVLYPSNYVNVLLHGASYILPVLLFLALYENADLLSPKPYWAALFIWSAIGHIQNFSLFSPIKPFLDAVFTVLVSYRYTSVPVGPGRGVSFLCSEPSDAAPVLMLFLLTGLFFLIKGKISRRGFYLAVVLVLMMLLENKSGSAFVLLMIFIAGAIAGILLYFLPNLLRVDILRFTKYAIVGTCIGFILYGVLYALPKKMKWNWRFLGIVDIAKDVITGEKKDLMETLIYMGGQRAIPLYVGYGSLFHNYGVGHGVASWKMEASFNEVMSFLHIKHTDYLYILGNEELTFHQNKPQSYLAIISYDTGILGVSIILFFLLLFMIRARNRGFQPAVFYVVKYGLLAVAFGWMGLFALIPHLMPWLVLCYVYSLFVGQTRQHQNVLARQKLSLCIA